MDELRLSLVTDRHSDARPRPHAVVGEVLAAGLPAVQVREKDLGAADLAFAVPAAARSSRATAGPC